MLLPKLKEQESTVRILHMYLDPYYSYVLYINIYIYISVKLHEAIDKLIIIENSRKTL